MVHTIPYRASSHRLFRFALSAGKTILAELNVMFNQVYLFNIAIRVLGFGTLYCLVDQSVGCFTLSRASYNRKKIHHGFPNLV
jgi:hypothetical protein